MELIILGLSDFELFSVMLLAFYVGTSINACYVMIFVFVYGCI